MSGQEMVKRDIATPATVREDFTGIERGAAHETAATAVAEQARARAEAQYIVALKRPRDMDMTRVRLLKECKRTGFAQVARYAKPVGGQRIVGPSIRFAEAAMRAMGNVDVRTEVIYDDRERRIVRVSVTDLESNASIAGDVAVQKVVERRKLRDGMDVIGTRANTEGQTVYIVAATDDELMVKQNALVSKAIRNGILRLLPGDILEECMGQVSATLEADTASDPDAERKRLVDAFAAVGVLPDAIKEVLGHDLATCSPAEMAELRAIYVGLSEGSATWAEIAVEKRKAAEASAAGEQAPAGKVDKLKADLEKKRKAAEAKKKGAEQPKACDGNHAAPACADPQCWRAESQERQPGDEG